MHRQHYGRVIREWCAVTGMSAWREDEDKHVEIGDTVCGLIPGGEDEPDVMHVLIDLGPLDTAGLHLHLLKQNVLLGTGDHGCFGVHPVTESVVYRALLTLEADTDGAELPAKITELIASARERLLSLTIQ